MARRFGCHKGRRCVTESLHSRSETANMQLTRISVFGGRAVEQDGVYALVGKKAAPSDAGGLYRKLGREPNR
jgi:hypothetical protein